MLNNSAVLKATLLGATLTLSLTFAQATQAGGADVVRGAVKVQQANGQWTAEKHVPLNKWVRADSSDTTLALAGSTVRMQEGTAIFVTQSDNNRVDIKAKDGEVFVKVQPDASCNVHTPTSDVAMLEGEAAVDTQSVDNLRVLGGSVSATPVKPAAEVKVSLKELDKALALDGPDVRKRNRNRRRFTQGEENKGKRIGEDAPATTSPSPLPETPAYTPTATPTPTFTPQPSPTTPPPQQTPPPSVGGGSPWPWLAPVIVAAGTGTYFLVRDTNDNNEPIRAVFPSSP